jgi:hypothetical protein
MGRYAMTMKKLVFAVGALALSVTATAPAHADYAIVSFWSGYCRIWNYASEVPPDGAFVWFVRGPYRYNRLPTLDIAEYKLHTLVARGLCRHW